MKSLTKQAGWVGAAIAGAASLLGGKSANSAQAYQAALANQQTAYLQEDSQQFNAQQAEETRAFNAREADINRHFQERLANSAHQREIEDLKKAGLNPILSGTGGMGSMTPSGGQASSSPASSSGGQGVQAAMRDVVTPAISTAAQAQLLHAQAETEKQRARIERSKADAIEPLSKGAKPYIEGGVKAIDDTIKNLSGAVSSAYQDYGQPIRSYLDEAVKFIRALPEKAVDSIRNSAASIGQAEREYSTPRNPKPWAPYNKNSTMGKPTGSKGRSFPGKWE